MKRGELTRLLRVRVTEAQFQAICRACPKPRARASYLRDMIARGMIAEVQAKQTTVTRIVAGGIECVRRRRNGL